MMNAQELRPEIRRRLKDVAEVLGIPPVTAPPLLQNYKWSKEAVLEAYMRDSEKLFKKCGIYHRAGNSVASKPVRECPICYDQVDQESILSMPCGHAFCLECWYDFCVNAIAEGPNVLRKSCPHAGCPEVVTEYEIKTALGSTSKEYIRYQSFQLRSFVESNALTRWCPGPGCERVACAMTASAMEAEGNVAHCDTCLIAFCLLCGNEPHGPSSCRNLALWLEKCRNESETANWILANTKECPKCVTRIEKNNGCNHMTCQKCSFEFCWICMGDWHDHGTNTGGYYKCNKYDTSQEPDKTDNSDSAKARRQLNRYLHFYKRFHAHAEGQKFAQKQLRETESRMILLQESTDNAKWTDVEFLKTANELLVECRRVLKFTYVYAYYLDPKQALQRERFEYHQEMLERFTENLSELSEKPLDQMDRTDVVNQTRVVDRFMKNILKYVEDGMEDAV
jgi:ariadne-1